MANIGGAMTAGAQTFGATTASLTGSGMGFEEVSDSLRFAWQVLTGDGSITARVSSFTADNGGNAFGGVMFRSTLDRESANVSTTLLSAGNVRFSRRMEYAAYTEITTAALSRPLWVRLTRAGNVFTSLHSPDSVTWTQLGPAANVSGAPATMFAGLLVASINNNGNTVANFDNISLIESGAAPVASSLTFAGGQNPSVANNFIITAAGSGTPTWSWEKVGGPGTVTFNTQNTATPKVAYTSSGVYTLRTSADDGAVKTYLERSLSFSLDARWNFNTTEGWSAANTTPPTFNGGMLGASASSGDPQISMTSAIYTSGDIAKHLLVRYRGSVAAGTQWFWGRVGAGASQAHVRRRSATRLRTIGRPCSTTSAHTPSGPRAP